MPDEPSPVESLPAMRAAGSRSRASSIGPYVMAGAALAAAALVILLVARPWSSAGDGSHPGLHVHRTLEAAQARFDAERAPGKIVEALAIGPGSVVADIGADKGMMTVHLARAVAPSGKVVATDINAGILDLLAENVDRVGVSKVVETRVVPANAPGLEDATYDAILLSRVDHLFSDPAAWLRAAKAALKPDGRIVITNLLHHRTKGMAAAEAAGLHLVRESAPTPTDYLAVFTATP